MGSSCNSNSVIYLLSALLIIRAQSISGCSSIFFTYSSGSEILKSVIFFHILLRILIFYSFKLILEREVRRFYYEKSTVHLSESQYRSPIARSFDSPKCNGSTPCIISSYFCFEISSYGACL